MLVKEISKALASNGLSIYKFVRSGKLMSKNDVEFHNNLKITDSDPGYKNDVDILSFFGLEELIHLSTENMPENNLVFIFQKP